MNITMRVRGADQFDATARRFRRAAANLQRRLVDALVAEGDAALAETRAAFRGIEVTSTRAGGYSSGLRRRVAAATRMERTAAGIAFEVLPELVDARYGATLAFGLDGIGTWAHPVFGNRRVWTTQHGAEVFYSTLGGRGSRFEARLERVVDDVAREIEG